MRFYRTLFLLLIFKFSACGGNSSPATLSLELNGGEKKVSDAGHGRIASRRLKLWGDAFVETIEMEFSKENSGLIFENIPTGRKFNIRVEYRNANEQIIYRATQLDLVLQQGVRQKIQMNMNPVPIFLNLKEKAIVANTRLTPKIFAAESLSFQVFYEDQDGEHILPDVLTDTVSFSFNTSLQPEFLIHPPVLYPGTTNLVVRDEQTFESTPVNIHIIDGSKQKGLVTSAGGYLGTLPNGALRSILQQRY